ncbi:hypothetical protein [Bradyrhizobium sp. USDA 4506]
MRTKNYSCLDSYLASDFFSRFINYYRLEWGHDTAPSDPKASAPRRADWPATPQSTPPMPFSEWPYGGTTSFGVTRSGSVDSPLMAALGNTPAGQWMNERCPQPLRLDQCRRQPQQQQRARRQFAGGLRLQPEHGPARPGSTPRHSTVTRTSALRPPRRTL